MFLSNIDFSKCPPNKIILSFGILTKSSFFPKWLPKPNHYARSIRLEILCRTPVPKFRELSYESESNLKTPNIVPWPECQPELPGDGGDDGDGVPTTLPIWQEPWTITHRNQITRTGIPHFDNLGGLRPHTPLHFRGAPLLELPF